MGADTGAHALASVATAALPVTEDLGNGIEHARFASGQATYDCGEGGAVREIGGGRPSPPAGAKPDGSRRAARRGRGRRD